MTEPRPTWDAAAAGVDTDPGTPLSEVDLEQDPRTEVEALCLCSLLWATRADAATVVDALVPGDFGEPLHRELFELVATQVRAGVPHDPGSISAALVETGKAGGHRGEQLRRTLTAVTTADADATAARHYAALVMGAAYRRGFHDAAAALAQAAAELPQDQLFDHLVAIGVEQRKATNRLRETLPHLR